MKKILLFMLPIMALSLASCEKNQGEEEWTDDSPIIRFKDPYFLNAVLEGGYRLAEGPNPITGGDEPWAGEEENVDKNGDGQISEKEASVVEALLVCVAGIRGMDEIKYFTALTWLDCYGNDLTSLDLSKNTALTWLDCGYNELTSLDLSKNTALTDLSCGDNQLTSLDVSKNTALTDLFCGGNQLTSLDVSKNTALTWLGCGDNELTSLDVSKNTALTNLSCDGNQLTSLDVSKNTALEWLDCSYNELTSLDLSKNTALEYLYCYSNPLQKLILYKYHVIDDDCIEPIESKYEDIIEYVE